MGKRKRWIISLIGMAVLFFMPCRVNAAKEKVLEVRLNKDCSTKTIQEALDRAKTMQKEGYGTLCVTLSPGSYKLDTDLVIYSNTTLVAADCTMFKHHEQGPILRNYLYDKEEGIKYAHDISVIGGIWNGGATLQQERGDESFRFIHAKRIVVRDLTIKSIVAGHLLTLAGVEGAVVDQCTFADYATYGTGKEAVHLDVVHSDLMVPVVESSKKRIVYDDAPCRNIKVTNCTFRNVPSGVGSHSSVRGVYQENIEIRNNTFTNIETAAIRCYNYKNTTISENKVEQAAIGVQVYTATTTSELNDDRKTSYHIPLENTKTTTLPEGNDYHITIEKNQIKTIYKGAEKKYGNGIYIFGCKKRPIGHLIIRENVISNTKNTGIRLKYAPDAMVENNRIENISRETYRGGIELVCSDQVVLQKNQLLNSQTAIMVNHSSNGIYQYNTISGCKYQGVYMNETSRKNKLYQNKIQDTGSVPVDSKGEENREK